jgi:NitT/TauT family transport system permease protein
MKSWANPKLIRRIVALAVLIGIWELLSRIGWLDPFYVPAPSTVASVALALFAEGDIWPHLTATFLAAFLGLLLGLVIGIVLGFAAALSSLMADLLEPVMIWLGIDLASKVALALILVAVVIFFAVFNGIREVDQRLVERVQTLGGGRSELIREVYVPSLTVWVLGNLKVAVGFAFTGAVVGEFVASSRGLGYLLQFAQSTYNAGLTIALIVLIMGFVLVLFAGAERLERRLMRWRG